MSDPPKNRPGTARWMVAGIWTGTYLGDAYHSPRADIFVYKKALEDALGNAHTADAKVGKKQWELPWQVASQNRLHFWQHYLNLGQGKHKQNAAALLDCAVPRLAPLYTLLRPRDFMNAPSARGISNPHQATQGESRATLEIEGYRYPHGLGLLVNMILDLPVSLSFKEMVDNVIEAFKCRTFFRANLNIGNIAQKAMRHLHSISGPTRDDARFCDHCDRDDDVNFNFNQKAFSVVTPVGLGGAPHGLVDNLDRESIHKALDGLCRMNPSWASYSPHPIDDASLPKIVNRTGEVLYGPRKSRGRVVWLPELLFNSMNTRGERVPRSPLVKLYHRNLALATLQTESLLGLLGQMPNTIAGISRNMSRYASFAAQSLGKLYEPSANSYRTYSVRKQIEDHLHLVNRVRRHFRLYELGQDAKPQEASPADLRR